MAASLWGSAPLSNLHLHPQSIAYVTTGTEFLTAIDPSQWPHPPTTVSRKRGRIGCFLVWEQKIAEIWVFLIFSPLSSPVQVGVTMVVYRPCPEMFSWLMVKVQHSDVPMLYWLSPEHWPVWTFIFLFVYVRPSINTININVSEVDILCFLPVCREADEDFMTLSAHHLQTRLNAEKVNPRTTCLHSKQKLI